MARKNIKKSLGTVLLSSGAIALGGCADMSDYKGTFEGYNVDAHVERVDGVTAYRTLRIADETNSAYIFAKDLTDRDGRWDEIKFRGKISGHPLEDFTLSDLEEIWYAVVPGKRF